MNKKDSLIKTVSLSYKYQIIARKLLSSRACYSSFGRSKFNQFLIKKPTIFGHITKLTTNV